MPGETAREAPETPQSNTTASAQQVESEGQIEPASCESDRRYRSLFENCPVALLEEDFSAVRKYIDDLRNGGVLDLRSWFNEHPEAVAGCSSLVKILDVNLEALRLFDAESKEAFLAGLPRILGQESYPQFMEQLIAISEDRLLLETEAIHRTLSGRLIHAALRWSVVPGCEESHFKVIVSLQDITEHRRSEQELSLLALTLRSVSECVSITDMSDNIRFVNEAFRKTYGYEDQELIGKNISMVRSPSNPPEVTREILPATLSGGWRGELLNRRRDGSEFRIYLSTSIVRDERQQPVFLVGIATDMTERRRVEEEIYRSRQMLQLILDNIPQRVFWKDHAFRYLGCNKAFASDASLSHPREIIGRDDFELSWRENAPRYRADDRQVMETGLPKLSFEEPQTSSGGKSLWLRTNKVPLHDRQGQIIGVLGTYEDITEQKRAEQALRASEEKYRKFFDEDLSGVYISTPGGELLACNQTFLQTFGFASLQEAMSADLASLYPTPQDRHLFLEELREHKKLERRETEARRKDGKPIYLVENAFGVFDDQGELVEIKGYLFDNTSRKKLEEQFRQSQKMEAVGRLAGGIAHDFNNLLTCINGYSELLTLKMEATDPYIKFAKEIHAAGERAAKLTRQLLAFSRRQVLQPEVLDLNTVVQGLEHMIRRLIGEDIDLSVIPGKSLARVIADRGQIEQVIMNLVVNARDAMPHGGHLVIQTAEVELDDSFVQEHSGAKTGKYVMLAVRDNGCGMGAEVRSHLFEPFFTTKEPGKGTGLGLSTVYGIVKQSDGYIAVDSEEGVGTNFALYLPRVERSQEQRVRKPVIPGDTQGSETILLVEDEQPVLELAQSLLQRRGYHIISAHDGLSALEVCGEHTAPIHLLVADVVMPKMSGRELARLVVARRPEIKVLFISGYSEDAIVNQGLLEPGTAFLQKPFTADSLPRKVREILDRVRG
ncbi:MAG TPA: PAS domain S-box protein [Acidobacteriota bacterium]|nr:PAS domain S-box protein [Acidobacteriota bacterium]